MTEKWKQYKPSSLFAIACGAVTAALGICAIAMPQSQTASYIAVAVTMLINTVLHYESCYTTWKTEKRKQPNVLSMAIAETVLLLFFGVCLANGSWTEFVILFSVYLVFNGTSLMAIPSVFPRNCGIAAVVLGGALFLFGRNFSTAGTVLTGLNLIVNGAERIIMAVLNGKKQSYR